MYVNDMAQAVKCDLYLYADDSCLLYTDRDMHEIEDTLNKNFNSLCDWFVESKLSIHFGEDKTKSIIFGSKRRLKDTHKLDIRRGEIEIKQHQEVKYLGCIFDCNTSGEVMAVKVLNKVNSTLRFLYRKQSILNGPLRHLLCNALIQPHFDYASHAWYPNLTKTLSIKLQRAQNKCIRFCLNVSCRFFYRLCRFLSFFVVFFLFLSVFIGCYHFLLSCFVVFCCLLSDFCDYFMDIRTERVLFSKGDRHGCNITLQRGTNYI